MGKPYYRVVAENRKARFDYNILETYEAGIALSGAEVKSIRLGRVNLKDSFALAERGEIWLYGVHISPYKFGTTQQKPRRRRKLLLKESELKRLIGTVAQKGLTLVPLKLYFVGDWAKVELALAKPKKKYEKREALRKKAIKREIERELTIKG